MSDLLEYKPGATFPGVIGRTVSESSPAWPEPLRTKEGAPNVIFFILDDVGYGQMSAFGGLIKTPNIDRLVQNGLRYTNMHTTALCSPTRSCILTGRNHHSNGVAAVMETATGFPRLRRQHALSERHAARDAIGTRLQYLLHWKMAPGPIRREHPGWSLPPLAIGKGF